MSAGVSQEDLAVDAGIDRSYVSRIERGIENPTVEMLEKLATALDAEMSDFFIDMPIGMHESPPIFLKPGRKPKGG